MSDDGPVTVSRQDWHTIWDSADLINEAVCNLSGIRMACEDLGLARAAAAITRVQDEVGRLRNDITKILLLADERMSPSAAQSVNAEMGEGR